MVFAALGRVHGGDDQVPRLARRERHANRLGVAKLAHHDDVGVFAERGLERRRERARVGPHFALAEQRFFAGMDVFDGVFDRDDVVTRLGIE